MQQLRNEAHRFAINFHRDQRSKNALGTELTDIPGIGEKTAQRLLQKFNSVKQIKTKSFNELAEAVGKKTARSLLDYFDDNGGKL